MKKNLKSSLFFRGTWSFLSAVHLSDIISLVLCDSRCKQSRNSLIFTIRWWCFYDKQPHTHTQTHTFCILTPEWILCVCVCVRAQISSVRQSVFCVCRPPSATWRRSNMRQTVSMARANWKGRYALSLSLPGTADPEETGLAGSVWLCVCVCVCVCVYSTIRRMISSQRSSWTLCSSVIWCKMFTGLKVE